MKKIYLFVFTILLSLSGAGQEPNLILVIADDLGTDYFNGYQNSNLLPTTPTLDSIRNVGITFNNVWSTPKCTPSRATIMSGKHGVKTGVIGTPGHLDVSHRSIFSAISDSTNGAYAGAVIGKWHISQPTDPMHPFDHQVDYYTGLMSSSVSDYYAWEHTHNGTTNINTDYATKVLTDSCIQWVNDQSQPWFLWLAHVAPHGPYHTPPDDTYSIANTDNNARKYVAMIESMDFELNRLLNNIPSDELENTVVIVIGDNGTPNIVLQNYPDNRGKATLYQGGVHVPMIISGAGVTRVGEEEDALVHITDLYATILELTGSNLPGGIYNSLSFKHLLNDSPGATRDYNYSEVFEDTLDQFAIRNTQYKLIQSNVDGTQEFYNLSNDEFELNDLIASGLSTAEQTVLDDLESEANQRRENWSCRDHIKNGDEDGIDCGGSFCVPCGTVGINDVEGVKVDFSIFPNPTQNQLTIRCNLEEYGVEISTIVGQVVLQDSAAGTEHQMDISALAQGLYIMRFFNLDNELIFESKLLKDK